MQPQKTIRKPVNLTEPDKVLLRQVLLLYLKNQAKHQNQKDKQCHTAKRRKGSLKAVKTALFRKIMSEYFSFRLFSTESVLYQYGSFWAK